MKKINLYYHGGSKNHGCEAIVRSTNKIIPYDLDLYSTAMSEDIEYGINEIVKVHSDQKRNLKKYSFKGLISAIYFKTTHRTTLNTKYMRPDLVNNINKGDIYLSIGGDNYCYPGVEFLGDLNYLFKKKKAKTVLWGCSLDSKFFNQSVINDLKRYDLITVRESLSKEELRKNGIIDNVVLYSDPAFVLDKVDLPLPDNFKEKNTVGINVSPLIIDCENEKGITMVNYVSLIEYIIKDTDMNVALIPHVVKEETNDLSVLMKLYNMFKDTNRVCLISDCNCMELKGFISRCRFFVGARTHATIAAYSTNVPTLVVGYSIKARGIAKDIFGTFDHYVIPVQSLKKSNDLVEEFKWLMLNENDIKNYLSEKMPEYKEQSMKAGNEIRRILEL